MLGPMLEQMLRLHLRHAVGTEALGADERAAGTLPAAREVAVAFADLVGFTRLGEEVPPAQLGAIASGRPRGDLAEPPVRLVKTIGDAATPTRAPAQGSTAQRGTRGRASCQPRLALFDRGRVALGAQAVGIPDERARFGLEAARRDRRRLDRGGDDGRVAGAAAADAPDVGHREPGERGEHPAPLIKTSVVCRPTLSASGPATAMPSGMSPRDAAKS